MKYFNWNKEKTGSPILEGVKAWLDCKKYQSIDVGDHIILIGRVVAFNSDAGSPLAYLQGEYVQLAPEKKSPSVLKDEYQITSLRELF